MRFKFSVLFCVAVVFGTVVIGFTTEMEIPASVVVVQTNDGFSPQEVIIKKGGSVTFRNISDKPFWPASDSHPEHTRYPEFDAKKPILPGEEWVFIFDQAGAWRYHDHLVHEIRGKVIVAGKQNESIKPCLARTADLVVRAECWEAEVAKVLKTRGLNSAFETVRNLYKTNPEFHDNCHYVMHAFGNATYLLYEKGEVGLIDKNEISWCNYGFYHGFIESMSSSKGRGNYQDILDFCESLGKSKNFPTPYLAQVARAECIHPLGYSIIGSFGSEMRGDGKKMVDAGLKICEKLFSDQSDQVRCSTGVFASFAAAYTNQFYDLPTSIDSIGLAELCAKQKSLYQRICYRFLPVVHIREKNLSLESLFKYLRSFTDPTALYWGIAGFVHDEIARPRLNITLVEWSAICVNLKNGIETDACISAVISGLSSRSEPGNEYRNMGEFCEMLRSSFSTTCFKSMFERIRRIYSSEKVGAICKEFLPEDSNGCVWK